MDPVGAGVGAVSLLFQVFAGCMKAYQLLSEARDLEENFKFFRIRLKTEEYRLLDWANVVKINESDDDSLISKVNRPIVVDVIDQQCTLLQRFGRIDDHLRPLTSAFIREDTSYMPSNPYVFDDDRGSDASMSLSARFPQGNSLLRRALRFADRTTKFSIRLRWVVTDRAKAEDLLSRLSALNSFLRDLLTAQQLEILKNREIRRDYQIIQMNNTLQDLREIIQAGFLSLQKEAAATTFGAPRLVGASRGIAHGLDDQEEPARHLTHLAQFKALSKEVGDGPISTEVRNELHLGSIQDRRPAKLAASDITPDDSSAELSGHCDRVLGWYRHPTHRIWIEWKRLEPLHRYDIRDGPDPTVLRRFVSLVSLLQENEQTVEFRAPRCLGYYLRETGVERLQYGLVFENPCGIDPRCKPTCLRELLCRQDDTPSLTSRLCLVQKLAICLERLHAVNWLHKGLRSKNILFFAMDEGSISLAEPYLSGFDYSRPVSAVSLSENPPGDLIDDLYRHPSVHGGARDDKDGMGYRKRHDIYSLGIVMLEIAYWKPIEMIVGFHDIHHMRLVDVVCVRDKLLDEDEGILSRVRALMGDTMEEVTRTCLTGPSAFGMAEEDCESEGPVAALLQDLFYENAVKPLLELKM